MDTGTLLTRNHEVKPPGGQSYRIREVHVRSGQSLAPGDAVCSLEYERSHLFSDDTAHLAECVFDVEKYGGVEVLEIAAKVGQEIPTDGCALFSYAVPATIGNALEPILADLVTRTSRSINPSRASPRTSAKRLSRNTLKASSLTAFCSSVMPRSSDRRKRALLSRTAPSISGITPQHVTRSASTASSPGPRPRRLFPRRTVIRKFSSLWKSLTRTTRPSRIPTRQVSSTGPMRATSWTP